MNIVYATDDKGALGTGVSIVSLMENLPADVHADIYIMTDGLNEDNTARLNSLQRSYRLSLHFIEMKDKYKDFPVGSKWVGSDVLPSWPRRGTSRHGGTRPVCRY